MTYQLTRLDKHTGIIKVTHVMTMACVILVFRAVMVGCNEIIQHGEWDIETPDMTLRMEKVWLN